MKKLSNIEQVNKYIQVGTDQLPSEYTILRRLKYPLPCLIVWDTYSQLQVELLFKVNLC